MIATDKIWMNGELVDWGDAKVHVGSHGLHYGTGVFEGIRAYETSQGPAVFRLTDHIVRLHNSAKILGMELPYSVDELVEATKATVASTGLASCYVRPLAYLGYGEMGLNTLPCRVDVAIALSGPDGGSSPADTYLRADAVIAVSAASMTDVLAAYPALDPARVHVVHNGIDTELYRPVPETDVLERLGMDLDRPIVSFVGRVTRQKGVPHLLRAALAFDPIRNAPPGLVPTGLIHASRAAAYRLSQRWRGADQRA